MNLYLKDYLILGVENQKNFGDNFELKEKIKTSNDSVNSYRKNLQIIQQQQ